MQFGGQTPLKLAEPLEKAKVPILGTSPDAIDLAEDRDRFKQLLDKLKLRQPQSGIATSPEQARAIADDIGYPIVIRPSYVLGGRAMEIVHDGAQLDRYLARLAGDLDRPSELVVSAKRPLLIDRYLIRRHRGRRRLPVRRQGHLHRRHHGAHRGGRHPFRRLAPARCRRTRSTARRSPSSSAQTRELALALNVGGLMNVQYAIKDGDIYILEVNPRASRTVPFVAKVIGLPVAKIAARVMAGESARARSSSSRSFDLTTHHVGVKEAVFPFARFGDKVDTVLGPEMKSTGEVMGLDRDYEIAFAKSQLGGGARLPQERHRVRLGPRRRQAEASWSRSSCCRTLGFEVIATSGTQRFLAETRGRGGQDQQGARKAGPHIVDAIKNGDVQLVFNTTEGATALADSRSLRQAALLHKVPYYTTLSGAVAAAQGIKAYLGGDLEVRALQSYFERTGLTGRLRQS